MANQAPSVDAVRNALRDVKEPALGRDVVSLGLTKKINVKDGTAHITIELPTPVYRHRAGLENAVAAAARKVAGITDVNVLSVINVPMGNRGAATRLPTVRNVVAVAAGKGGVGKSTVATNLALALRQHGAKVGLLDA